LGIFEYIALYVIYHVIRKAAGVGAPQEEIIMPTKPDLSRVLARPDPDQWAADELLTLPEAAQLMWPNGPLCTASLRTAARDGRLVITVIAGKHLTTKAALKGLSVCSIL
jgi:hypothetical protein